MAFVLCSCRDEEQDEDDKPSNGYGDAPKSLEKLYQIIDTDKDKLVQEEKVHEGRVSFNHYLNYFQKIGWICGCFLLSSYVFCDVIHIGNNLILGLWSDDVSNRPEPAPISTHHRYVYYYVILVGVGVIINSLREYLVMMRCADASYKIHSSVLESLMHAPMHFFDATPTGRIINRLSSDVEVIDTKIPKQLSDALFCAIQGK